MPHALPGSCRSSHSPCVGYLPRDVGVLCPQRGGHPGPHHQQVVGLGFKPRQSGSKAHSLSTKPGCLGGVPGKMALGFALLLLPPRCLCSDGLSRGRGEAGGFGEEFRRAGASCSG